jgi:hypothetical protein
MTKTKYPELEDYEIKKDTLTFKFSGGDLWFRNNVNKFDDLGSCIDQMRNFIHEHPGNINIFDWYLSYFLPDTKQLKQLKNNKIKDYEVDEDHNIHCLTPITYNHWGKKKDNKLWVAEDLLIIEEEFILEVVNKLSNVKTIVFTADILFDGFLDLYSTTSYDEYVRKDLNNEKWFDGTMTLDKSYRDPEVGGKFLNELDSLLYIKKNINSSITFEFNHITDKEKEILKSQNLIS